MKDIIFGWPNVTRKDVATFQKNHKIQIDGKIGRQTRSRMWRERGANGYTHLIGTILEYGGDKKSAGWIRWYLFQNPKIIRKTGLSCEAIITIWKFLSSQWKTGMAYLSTQDGVTAGPRRLAAGSLQRVLKENRELFLEFFSKQDFRKMVRKQPDRKREKYGYIPDKNNGFPLDQEHLRIAWLKASQDKRVKEAFFLDGMEMIQEILDQYPHWTDARLICLAIRAANSARYQYTQGLPQKNERRAYRRLRKDYSKAGKTKKRRIERIEKFIPKGTKWQRK